MLSAMRWRMAPKAPQQGRPLARSSASSPDQASATLCELGRSCPKTPGRTSAAGRARRGPWHAVTVALFACAAQGSDPPKSAPNDYEHPRLLTGTIYAPGPVDRLGTSPAPRQTLFTFRRTSAREGNDIRVQREYRLADGTVAARERVAYAGDRLVSYELEDLRSGEKGRAVVQRRGGGQRDLLRLEFAASRSRQRADQEILQPTTIVNDMLPGFLLAHWAELMSGARIKCRFVVLSRTETVGFEIFKDSEVNVAGRPAVRVRMEPASMLIAQLVNPVFFVVEKDGEHRILEYTGRTTPRVKSGSKWKDLDAVTVFDWR